MKMRIAIAALLAAGAAMFWFQHKQAAAQRDLIAMYKAANDDLLASTETLALAYEDTNRQVMLLMQSQQRIHQNLSSRQAEVRRLQNDVEEIRAWANHPLPDDVVRMRSRPAIIGAESYGSALSAGDPVRPDSSQPDDER